MKGMSQQMTDMRKSMQEDKQLGVLMAGLRGSNMDESDFADDSVVMQLVEVAHDDNDQLPLAYDPISIAAFWGRRPVAVIRRALQLFGKLQIRIELLPHIDMHSSRKRGGTLSDRSFKTLPLSKLVCTRLALTTLMRFWTVMPPWSFAYYALFHLMHVGTTNMG